MKTPLIVELEAKAALLRKDIVRMIGVGKPGHVGGSCSIADIMAALYFHQMKHDPKNPQWEGRDRLIMSKGHAGIIQYAALAECGYFDKEILWTLKDMGSILQGHPDRRKVPGIEMSTGSLGQGFSAACGMAAGLRVSGSDNNVYCVIGDGELAEGQIWEAALTGVAHKLDHLVVILDNNTLQAMGPITQRYNTAVTSYADKFRNFGWRVIEIDGNDMEQIVPALDVASVSRGMPTCIVAHTIKGKGLAFAENQVGFHNGAMTQEQYDSVMGGEPV